MPINIPDTLPASRILESENIFVMNQSRAMSQDIRPLRIVILNLMPTKVETETQLLRMLGNSPIQVDIELLQTSTYTSRNTPTHHLLSFYKTFDQIADQRFDGMIVTGAPVEQMEFEQVDYWEELCTILDWAKRHVYSTLFICWGAQAALYHYYNIPKYTFERKLFGIFPHRVLVPNHRLVRGFDDIFYAPHSRHTGIRTEDIAACPQLEILTTSPHAGVYLAASRDGRQIFVTGHSEYDRDTLAKEYFRDLDRGLPIELPVNYFPGDDPSQLPRFTWRGHGNLLYSNWLNYFVYQQTPFDLSQLEPV